MGCMRTTPLVAYEILLGFPPLDLWIRTMAFKVTCRILSHSSHGGQMDWELVEQLGIQALVVLDRCSKRWLFEKAYKVTIGERSEWKGSSHELRKQGLIWFTDESKTENCWRETAGECL